MISEKLKEQLGDWEILYPFFESEEWGKMKEKLKPDMETITPQVPVWFRAFKECKYANLKVVFLGLSPYFNRDSYTKENVADGLAFSTSTKHTVPPSLFKIYKGMEWDLWKGMNLDMQRSNDLTFLANQGVLLLNSALTTTYGNPDSHLEIWKPFIEFVLKTLVKNNKQLIFVGFGRVANDLLTPIVDEKEHHLFKLEHPAASAYQSRDWAHNNLFSKIDTILSKTESSYILWDKHLLDMDVPF